MKFCLLFIAFILASAICAADLIASMLHQSCNCAISSSVYIRIFVKFNPQLHFIDCYYLERMPHPRLIMIHAGTNPYINWHKFSAQQTLSPSNERPWPSSTRSFIITFIAFFAIYSSHFAST